MNDLDTFRRALRLPGEDDAETLDVGAILRGGKRLRRRRRLTMAGAALCAAVALFAGISQLTRTSPAQVQRPAAPARHSPAPAPTTAGSRAPSPSPVPSSPVAATTGSSPLASPS